MIEQHEANRAFWNASADWWREKEDKRGLWRRAAAEPSLVLCRSEMDLLRDAAGKRACVVGSGDNEVAFALAGLGADVTSVDISQKRLDTAAARARELELRLSFVCADATDLQVLDDCTFDISFTGGHMSVWISDIRKYYAESVRILKQGGLFLVNEYHPIRRMWLDSEGLEPRHGYFDRGPHKYVSEEGLATFEYHWTVADHVQAVIDAGCALLRVEEYGGKLDDEYWLKVRLDKFPGFLMIAGRRCLGSGLWRGTSL
jgi:ubiquinone/menaquinone biosynthesis C-methylase UbiE